MAHALTLDPPRPSTPPAPRAATPGEEIANSVVHGLGLALAIAGLAVLVARAAVHGDAWHLVSGAVYGVALILLYAASTLYHAIPLPRVRAVFLRADHACIHLLIAGTYTPFTLVTLRGPWGYGLFGVIWSLALAGATFEILFAERFFLFEGPSQ